MLNVDFVLAHEQLRTNVNAFWGPESAPFRYTTSKWGRESSVEMSVRATHTPMLLVPRVAQIDSLPIKIQNPACQGSANKA